MEKNLQLERMVFFCDAVVAIAITLLVFNLKLDPINGSHLTFADLGGTWQRFIAFAVSFLNIAIFWTIHHSFFSYIKKIDVKLMRYNLYWLFFIVIIPFSASLVSSYLSDTPAIFVYSLNIFLVTLFQNQIWDYVAARPEFIKEDIAPSVIYNYRLSCNVAMFNALLAVGVSFISPLAAFILLFLRLPFIGIAKRIFKKK
ncbi:TMEM175 family protein [Mucilaginibacter sp. X4EP1]|uniref:TMEM175 family protein n=1 Tax=Mucilaginibacter sp. X4EP1 TaxID=2723092 RepID=UPI002168C669|nr:TMEM175 family protein [Mucilaginibacter sp. X4EP1]MCS3814658.1 putative membrane protein [Mucilaginibacter sp. X4EP1]